MTTSSCATSGETSSRICVFKRFRKREKVGERNEKKKRRMFSSSGKEKTSFFFWFSFLSPCVLNVLFFESFSRFRSGIRCNRSTRWRTCDRADQRRKKNARKKAAILPFFSDGHRRRGRRRRCLFSKKKGTEAGGRKRKKQQPKKCHAFARGCKRPFRARVVALVVPRGAVAPDTTPRRQINAAKEFSRPNKGGSGST